ncbi:MAG: anion permease, partial [Candidatus Brocadiae bacterium]|nr:anion permease [Candidatus Brocadiia bacterium]
AMTLPISTPPNAMAQASGRIESKDMFRSGLAIGFVGILLLYGFMYILFILNFFRQI